MGAKETEVVFLDEEGGPPAPQATGGWKVLIADDEEMVHSVTKLALDGFRFGGRGLAFHHAYSGEQTRRFMEENPDTALVLLDVVMETEDAGLRAVRYIRHELGNHSTRIVLRTGQPGQAPERSVIAEYDINDYKEKTELTALKLFTLMHAALRSYRDIVVIAESKRGLEQIIKGSAEIFRSQSLQMFSEGVLKQMTSLIGCSEGAICATTGEPRAEETIEIVAATGKYESLVGQKAGEVLKNGVLETLRTGFSEKGESFSGGNYLRHFQSRNGAEKVLYFERVNNPTDLDRNLVRLFFSNVAVAFDNLALREEIDETQREIVFRLGDAVETRCQETANHVRRVAEISRLLARKVGLDEQEAEVVALAAPLHDVGKLAIPDGILNKPGKLKPAEWEVMKTHAARGYDLLETSRRRILKAGSIIARTHHERWDGGGYPSGAAGEDIHLYGRLVAVADVFDALGTWRCYKEPWPLGEIFDYFRHQRGKQFDPALVDVFLGSADEFKAIREAHGDGD